MKANKWIAKDHKYIPYELPEGASLYEDDEVVHHINENKLDNSPENLLVLTKSEHIRLHANLRKRGKNGQFKI